MWLKTCVCCYTFHESTRNLHQHTPFVTSITTYRPLSCHVITNRSYASDKNCPELRTTRIPCEQVINHRWYITTSLHRHFVNIPPLGPSQFNTENVRKRHLTAVHWEEADASMEYMEWITKMAQLADAQGWEFARDVIICQCSLPIHSPL